MQLIQKEVQKGIVKMKRFEKELLILILLAN